MDDRRLIIVLARELHASIGAALAGDPCQLERDETRARAYADIGGKPGPAFAAVERIATAFGLHMADAERDRGELGELARRVVTRWRIDHDQPVDVDALAELVGTAPSLLRRHRQQGRLAARGGGAGRGHTAWVDAAEARRWLAARPK